MISRAHGDESIRFALDGQLRSWLALAHRAESYDPTLTRSLLDRAHDMRCLVDRIEEVDRSPEPELDGELRRLCRSQLDEVVRRIDAGEFGTACRLSARILELVIVQVRWLRPENPSPSNAPAA